MTEPWPEPEHVGVLIVGGGPCGLGAARQLDLLGHDDWLLVDAAAGPGGLASSFVDPQGFTWDVGAHVQFSHYTYFDDAMIDLLGEDGWSRHDRRARIWMRDRFIPYPIQNNLHRLPPAERDRALRDLDAALAARRDATTAAPPAHFGEWVQTTFGTGLATSFMEPYNEKVWAHPLDQLSTAWVGERVAVPDLERLRRFIAEGGDDTGWGPNATFAFPVRGGTGAIWRVAAERLPPARLRFATAVVDVDLAGHVATTADGHRCAYDHLISTVPLDRLVAMAGLDHLAGVVAQGLLHSSSHIIGLGLAGHQSDAMRDSTWLYFPEDDMPFYRATPFSNYSLHHVPDPERHWSMMFEVAESTHRPVDRTSVVADVERAARRAGLIGPGDEVVSRWTRVEPYGYPTPGLHREDALAEVLPALEAHDVYSRGRFGLWRYEVSNQDHTFMQGVEVVERLVNGRPEITAVDADHANSTHHPWPFTRWDAA